MKNVIVPALLFSLVIAVVYSTYGAISITGAGSTFISPVFTEWAEAYAKLDPGIQFHYQSIGSLQGVDQLLSHSAAFAASDAPLHLEQMKEPSCATLYFPTVVGAVVVVYNLPQLPSSARIRLSGQVLGDIYLGKIKTWNDPAIGGLNPTISLPNQPIRVHYRRDGSGTTFTFTDYLTKANTAWARNVGAGMLATWPVGLSADGNQGVVEAVKQQNGAIGYVELSYAVAKNLPYALLQNRASDWIDANAQTIAAAADSLVDSMRNDLQQSITDAPDRSAYPISSYSYLLFFKQQKDSTTVEAFSKFVDWILHAGQAYAVPMHYAPVPEKIAERAVLQLKRIEVGTATIAASCKASLGLAKKSVSPPLRIDPDTTGSLFSD